MNSRRNNAFKSAEHFFFCGRISSLAIFTIIFRRRNFLFIILYIKLSFLLHNYTFRAIYDLFNNKTHKYPRTKRRNSSVLPEQCNCSNVRITFFQRFFLHVSLYNSAKSVYNIIHYGRLRFFAIFSTRINFNEYCEHKNAIF